MQFGVFLCMCVSPSAVSNCLRGPISYKALRCTISLQITSPLISTWERCCICRSECYSCAHGFAILMMNSSSLTLLCHILKCGNFDFDLFSVSDVSLSVIKRCFLSTGSLKWASEETDAHDWMSKYEVTCDDKTGSRKTEYEYSGSLNI